MEPLRQGAPPPPDGYFRSRRGEFRLVPLPGGGTRLEGSTLDELDVHARAYWHVWSDALVHAIHRRVLRHVKAEAEGEGQGSGGGDAGGPGPPGQNMPPGPGRVHGATGARP